MDHIEKSALVDEFRGATETAIEHSDYISTSEVLSLIDRRFSEANQDEHEDDVKNGDDMFPVTLDELKDKLPDDVYRAVRAHLAEENVRKQLDEETVDPTLAAMFIENQAKLAEELEDRDQKRELAAEAVAQGDPGVELLEATGIYSEDEV